jgi:hypothetical protein
MFSLASIVAAQQREGSAAITLPPSTFMRGPAVSKAPPQPRVRVTVAVAVARVRVRAVETRVGNVRLGLI